MVDRREQAAHAANLLICVGVLVTSTGVIAGAGAVVSGYLSWRAVCKRLPAETKSLADELTATLSEKLSALDPDTAALIPQMIEASLPEPNTIVEAGLQAEALSDRMVASLIFSEHKLEANTRVFRRIVTPILARLLDDPGFVKTLAPAYQRTLLMYLSDMAANLTELNAKYGSLAKSLDDLRELKRSQLELLCEKFGLPYSDEQSDKALVAELCKKAQDVATYRSDIAAIDERTLELGNLKAAAQEAAERLDFAEVEALLSRVDEVETEVAAESKELRARNALLRGRVEEAYRMFVAAADSFGSVDPAEPARRRDTYAVELSEHGHKYGNAANPKSIEMMEGAIASLSGIDAPDLIAQCQGNLGKLLGDESARKVGSEAARLSLEAEKSLKLAIKYFYTEYRGLAWAMGVNNLGSILLRRGRNDTSSTGAVLLSQAADCYRTVLNSYFPEVGQQSWPQTHNNLGIVLRELGDRAKGNTRLEFLNEAEKHLRIALDIYQHEGDLPRWGETKNNLGSVLQSQSQGSFGLAEFFQLNEARKCFEAAHTVRTLEIDPVGWAETHIDLALVNCAFASFTLLFDVRKQLNLALSHAEAALGELDPAHMAKSHHRALGVRNSIVGFIADLPA